MLKTIKKHGIPILFLLVFTFAFSLSTYFSPYSKETFGHDAGIFAYIGYAITKGVPLYTGAWDNKGPLLYIINALGVSLNYRYGIYILEFISLFTTLFFMYKTASFFVPKYVAVIDAALAMMPLTITLEGGNLSEEWALPFTVIAFYFIVKFFYNKYFLKKYEMMAVGACIAAIILLRLNIIMFIAVAVLSVIIILIKEKQIKILLDVALYAFIGFIIFLLPFVVYLILTKSLFACLDTAYFGIVGSFSALTKMQLLTNISAMIFRFIQSGGFFIIIFFVLIFPFYYYKTKEQKSVLKTLLVICFFGLFATLIGNSISGVEHMHYFMCFMPVMLLPVVWFSKAIYSFLCSVNVKSFAAIAVIAAFSFILSVDSISTLRYNIIGNLRDGTELHLQSQAMKVSDFVKANSSPDDTVLLIGDATTVTSYYRAKRIAASNYFYYANGLFNDNAKNEFANEILKDTKENLPAIILFSNKLKLEDFLRHLDNPEDFTALLENNYVVNKNDFSYISYMRVGE